MYTLLRGCKPGNSPRIYVGECSVPNQVKSCLWDGYYRTFKKFGPLVVRVVGRSSEELYWIANGFLRESRRTLLSIEFGRTRAWQDMNSFWERVISQKKVAERVAKRCLWEVYEDVEFAFFSPKPNKMRWFGGFVAPIKPSGRQSRLYRSVSSKCKILATVTS